MNQRWFNGIGNYLRAEILYRADINPFMSGREALTNHQDIFKLCKSVSEMAYLIGGGKVKNNWGDFMLCYGNPAMATIMDKNGRRFWFNPIWSQKL